MALKDIRGQDKALKMLYGLLKRQRIGSSYIFCGEQGIGKKTTAINFAKAVNCLSRYKGQGSEIKEETESTSFTHHNISLITDVDACDTCDSCHKIDAGTHPDFLLITPHERQIRINEIRMIEESLSFRPYEGYKKVVVIDDAEAMSISAANAFLKTLEEPPADSLVILISSRPDMLPATIRSRCSRINFRPLSVSSCKEVLKNIIKEKDLDLLSRLAMGCPGLAITNDLLDERKWFLETLEGMFRSEKDSWASREEMERWIEIAMIFLRDIVVSKITEDRRQFINFDITEYLKKTGKSVDLKVIIELYKELSTIKSLLVFNLNKSITWNFISSLIRRELAA